MATVISRLRLHAVVGIGLTIRSVRAGARREFATVLYCGRRSCTLDGCRRDVVVLDVRLPLDLLADSEIIPGAVRISPKRYLGES